MKLIIVTHLFPNSFDATYGIFFLDQFKAIKDIGVDVKIIVPTPYMPKFLLFIKPSWKKYTEVEVQAKIHGIGVFYVRYVKWPWQWFLNFEGLFMYFGIKNFLKKLRKNFKYQAVLGGMLTNDGYAALKIGQKDKIPAFSYIVGSDINVYPQLSKSLNKLTYKLLNELDGIVSVGGEFSKIAENKFPGLNKKIIWNSLGIDLDLFRPLAPGETSYFKENYSVVDTDIVFLFVGHLIEQKGIKTLLNALVLLKDQPIKLFLVGSGNLNDWSDRFIRENYLEDQCIRLGNVEYSNLPKIYRSADIFVLPSFREGSPTVLIEAAASGLPILASDIPQNKDVLIKNKNGLEFKVGDSKDLSKKIKTLLMNADLRDTYSKESRRIAQNDHERIKAARDLKKVISNFLNNEVPHNN